ALRAHIENPLLSTWIPTESSIGRRRVDTLVETTCPIVDPHEIERADNPWGSDGGSIRIANPELCGYRTFLLEDARAVRVNRLQDLVTGISIAGSNARIFNRERSIDEAETVVGCN